MIDVVQFKKLKDLGLAQVIQESADKFVIGFSQFDLERAKLGDRVQLPDEVFEYDKKFLTDKRTVLTEQLAALEELLGALRPVVAEVKKPSLLDKAKRMVGLN